RAHVAAHGLVPEAAVLLVLPPALEQDAATAVDHERVHRPHRAAGRQGPPARECARHAAGCVINVDALLRHGERIDYRPDREGGPRMRIFRPVLAAAALLALAAAGEARADDDGLRVGLSVGYSTRFEEAVGALDFIVPLG